MNEFDVLDRIFQLLRELEEEIRKNKYALSYFYSLPEAAMFGLEGVKVQVRYILNNIRVPREKKSIKKELLKLTK